MGQSRRNVVVLIDKFFPYEHGEEFLENEIKYALQYVDKLIIVPMEALDYSKIRIQDDKKLTIVRRPRIRGRIQRIVPCIRYLFKTEVYKEAKHQNNILGLSNKRVFEVASSLEYQNYVMEKTWDLVSPLLKKDDNVIFYSYWADKCALMAGYFKSKFSNSKAISRAHRFDIYCEERHYFLPFRDRIYNGLDRLYSISQNGKSYLENKYPKFKAKFGMMRLGTTDYGICQEKENKYFTIVSCSSFVSVKRINLLIEALSNIKLNIKWIHYGEGELRRELEEKARNELPKNVNWTFKGRVLNRDLMEEYKKNRYDLFVNVSESEGIPVSIMEVMSFGIPVIATDVGGTSEIVVDGYNGYLIKQDFIPEELTRKIIEFYDKGQEQKEDFRINARKYWESNFSAEANYKMFYETILDWK